MKTFYKFLFEEEKSIEYKIIDFFRKNPNPSDKMVHEFANKEEIDEHKFEEIIYKLFSNYVKIGKNRDKKDSDFDSKELKLGIKIEMEHIDDESIAKEIAKDHLSELPDYYSKLVKMEKD